MQVAFFLCLFEIYNFQKWRWALAQMAVHCVENKMKTSLGKATDTFNAIGAEVQRLGKVALKIADDRKPQHRRQEMKSPRRVQKDEDQVDDDYGLDRYVFSHYSICLLLESLLMQRNGGAFVACLNLLKFSTKWFSMR